MSERLTTPQTVEQVYQPEVANVDSDSLERTIGPTPVEVADEDPAEREANLSSIREKVASVHRGVESGGIYGYGQVEYNAWKQQQEAQKAARRADYETLKQQRRAEQEAQKAEGRAKIDAWRKEHPPLAPEKREALAELARQRAEQEREQYRRNQLQLDSEELHAKIGKPGLRRLLHPFRNARILFTIAKRKAAGEYNPNLKQYGPLRTPEGLIAPFSGADDPLAQARHKREHEKREVEEIAKITNPFEN